MLDLSTVVGIAGGITGFGFAIRSAKLGDLRAELAQNKADAKEALDKVKADAKEALDNLGRQSKEALAGLTEQFHDLKSRYSALEVNLAEEQKKVGFYYGQNLDFKEANRLLVIEANDKGNRIIGLQDELLDIKNNTLKLVQ